MRALAIAAGVLALPYDTVDATAYDGVGLHWASVTYAGDHFAFHRDVDRIGPDAGIVGAAGRRVLLLQNDRLKHVTL